MSEIAWVVAANPRKGLPKVAKIVTDEGVHGIPEYALAKLNDIGVKTSESMAACFGVYEIEVTVKRRVKDIDDANNPQPVKLQLVDLVLSDKYMNKARDWMENSPSAAMFSDCKSITKRSIAEFLANQDGYTLYENIAGREMK